MISKKILRKITEMVGANGASTAISLDITNRLSGGGCYKMKKRKLNYIFHNPNTPEATADYILKLFIEANASKVEAVIRQAVGESKNDSAIKCDEGYPA
jgi:hypothetical protein